MAYTAYVLDEASREKLKNRFPPKYEEFVGHHVTEAFGVPESVSAPESANVRVIGHVDSGDGLEALVVLVDKSKVRPDGKIYHVTWSLDREKYAPKDSNNLLATKPFLLTMPIDITTTPSVLK